MAKRIRWGRVLTAFAAVPLLGLGGWFATAPAPSVVPRRVPGPDDCSVEQVLATGDELHGDHADPEDGPLDELAASIVLKATRCARVEEPADRFSAWRTVWHGEAWIARNEPAPDAVAHLLDIWDLAADLRHTGGFVGVPVWNAVGLTIADDLEQLLDDPSVTAADRRLAAARLRAIASAPVDWDEVEAREERESIRNLGRVRVDHPADWYEALVQVPAWLWDLRVYEPIVDAFGETVDEERAAALALADRLQRSGEER